MKNLKLAALTLTAAGFLSACTSTSAPKASFATKADSISYAIGMSNFPPQLRQMLTEQLGDSTLIEEMIKGAKAGFSNTSKKEKAYAMGVSLGQSLASDMPEQISQQLFGSKDSKVLNTANFLQAFIDAAQGKPSAIEDAATYLQENMESLQAEALEKEHGAYKKENADFLAENGKKEGVVTTESGLQYKVLAEGKGDLIKEDDVIKLSYKGTLTDGTEFDANESAEFNGTNGLVKGFKEALELMKKGSKMEVYIPQELGYGSRPAGNTIKPFSTLVFTIEILDINPAK